MVSLGFTFTTTISLSNSPNFVKMPDNAENLLAAPRGSDESGLTGGSGTRTCGTFFTMNFTIVEGWTKPRNIPFRADACHKPIQTRFPKKHRLPAAFSTHKHHAVPMQSTYGVVMTAWIIEPPRQCVVVTGRWHNACHALRVTRLDLSMRCYWQGWRRSDCNERLNLTTYEIKARNSDGRTNDIALRRPAARNVTVQNCESMLNHASQITKNEQCHSVSRNRGGS